MGRGRCGHVITWVLLVWIPSRLLLLSRSARATTGSPLAARGVLSASVWGKLFACRRAGRGGTRTNISTTQTSLSLTTCRANTAQLEVCFLVFAYSWLRRRVIHAIANVCMRACNLNTTPNVLAELHTFIQSLIDMPSKRPGTCPPPRLSRTRVKRVLGGALWGCNESEDDSAHHTNTTPTPTQRNLIACAEASVVLRNG